MRGILEYESSECAKVQKNPRKRKQSVDIAVPKIKKKKLGKAKSKKLNPNQNKEVISNSPVSSEYTKVQQTPKKSKQSVDIAVPQIKKKKLSEVKSTKQNLDRSK